MAGLSGCRRYLEFPRILLPKSGVTEVCSHLLARTSANFSPWKPSKRAFPAKIVVFTSISHRFHIDFASCSHHFHIDFASKWSDRSTVHPPQSFSLLQSCHFSGIGRLNLGLVSGSEACCHKSTTACVGGAQTVGMAHVLLREHVYVCVCVCVCVCGCVCVCVCCLTFVRRCFHFLFVGLFVCLLVCLFVCLFACLCVCMFVCLIACLGPTAPIRGRHFGL